jgi:hypothetical protein
VHADGQGRTQGGRVGASTLTQLPKKIPPMNSNFFLKFFFPLLALPTHRLHSTLDSRQHGVLSKKKKDSRPQFSQFFFSFFFSKFWQLPLLQHITPFHGMKENYKPTKQRKPCYIYTAKSYVDGTSSGSSVHMPIRDSYL